MIWDIQKAGLWKRASAFLLDAILLAILAMGFAFLLSAVTGYNAYNDTLTACYDRVESEYGVEFEITGDEYEALSEEDRARWDEAYRVLTQDGEAMKAYSMVVSLTLLITSIGILAAFLVLEFVVPLLFGNGQTLGKKVFGIGLVRQDGVKIRTPMLFARTVLGKYTLETMIPVLIVIMIFFNMIGAFGTAVLVAILVLQLIVCFTTKTRSFIHDLLAGTAVVDLSSQMVFESEEAMIEYKKKIHAESVAREKYD